MTHLALLLARELNPALRERRVEIFCASSDGVDGRSGSAGAWVSHEIRESTIAATLSRFDSARALAPGLLPSTSTGLNVQDLAIVRLL